MSGFAHYGHWAPASDPVWRRADLAPAVERIREPVHILRHSATGHLALAFDGAPTDQDTGWAWLASLPAQYPEWLGDRSFCEVHNLRFPYVAGAMANGIATTRLVKAMASSGMLGFFGAAGLRIERVKAALDELSQLPAGVSWGSNLIHSPAEPSLEAGVVDLYLARGVRRVSASAYMKLTAPAVRYAASGLSVAPDGSIQRQNFLFAKISRPETASRFLSPAPTELLRELVAAGQLSEQEARLAARVPVAEDYIVESDSGGHTDNQTLTALFPSIHRLAEQISRQQGYTRPIRLGAAGGIGTPSAAAAALGLGAAFVLTGSVNQAALESGLSESGRRMLAQADIADVVMAPAADMFELGVEVQVLKRGTMFASRGHKLYELYRRYESLDELPAADLGRLERQYFKKPLADAWADTRAYWLRREPAQAERAERDAHHKMALLFRAYLGQSSRWAIAGDPGRTLDYQIWCGPAQGAFNRWAEGSFLAPSENRAAAEIAANLMEGAAVITRAQQLRSFGLPVPPAAFDFRPRPLTAAR